MRILLLMYTFEYVVKFYKDVVEEPEKIYQVIKILINLLFLYIRELRNIL